MLRMVRYEVWRVTVPLPDDRPYCIVKVTYDSKDNKVTREILADHWSRHIAAYWCDALEDNRVTEEYAKAEIESHAKPRG
jgi:hypothetical protein